MLYLQLNDIPEAERLFLKVLDISPEDEQLEILYNVANSFFFLHMYPETIECCEKIILSYPSEQTEALYLIACSHYYMFNIDSCMEYLTTVWKLSNNRFEDEYIEDKRFNHMFTNIIALLKKNL